MSHQFLDLVTVRRNRIARHRASFAIFFLIAGSAFGQNPQHWMQDLQYRIGNLPLNQVAIPGTHDSGTYSLDPNSPPSIDSPIASIENSITSDLGIVGQKIVNPILGSIVNPLIYKWAVAQNPNDNISVQLLSGIRYFDIRPCMDSAGNFRVCHSLYGTTISDLVSQVQAFSLENPQEIIILDFNHITSHGITGQNSLAMANEIIYSLSKVTYGDMIIPHQPHGSTLTLNQIWAASATARIVVLDDDSYAVQTDNYHLWPGQGRKTADIHSPWPSQDTVAGEIQHEMATLQCRCDEESAPYKNGEDASTLFVVQTNVTPDTSLIAGDLISELESKIGQPTCDITGICPALNKLASKEGWNTNPPPGIRALGDQTNTANYETFATGDNRQGMLLAGLLEKTPSLRQNLNIVQADWFDEMYWPQTTTVIPSPYVADMIKLNMPPLAYMSVGSPQYSPYGQIGYVTSHTPLTVNASDVNWDILKLSYSFGPYQGSGAPGSSFTIASAPTPQPDGYVEIHYGATNNVGLSTEMAIGDAMYYVIVDNTPPVMTITTPANGSGFSLNGPDLLNYTVSDGGGSGVASFTALIDGRPAPASGQPFLAGLAAGLHTFTLGPAVDHLGNTAPAISVTFSVGVPYLPVVNTVTPNSVAAGTIAPEILAVTGSMFVPGDVVQCNGTSLTTRFINSGRLMAYLPPSLMTTPSTAAITVADLASGGGVSTALSISILGHGETTPTPDSIWSQGPGLAANQELLSHNGTYWAIMQSDGNFVVYTGNYVPLWASNTYGHGSSPFSLLMQNDGNVVLYANSSQCAAGVACLPTWASNTYGKGIAPYVLVMQNDGNLVAYDSTLAPIWATGTNR